MGSRTTIAIYSYRDADFNNIVTLIPSIRWKYFYPEDVTKNIIDKKTFDFQKMVSGVSGWEGHPLMDYSDEYLPTLILLEGEECSKGSFVIFFKKNNSMIALRSFSFEEIKGKGVAKIEEDINKELETGIETEESKRVKETFQEIFSEIKQFKDRD